MKIYIARHGQIASGDYYGNPLYPVGTPPLSELGRKQATLLGKRLHSDGFSGDIYCSPYHRTLETAELIADETGSKIYPYTPIREIMMRDEDAANMHGLTLAEIREKYRHIADDAPDFPFPWWTMHTESGEDVCARVNIGMDALERKGDILCVGHGASCFAMMKWLGLRDPGDGSFMFNCALSMRDPEDESVAPFYCDHSHIPDNMVTNNAETLAEHYANK